MRVLICGSKGTKDMVHKARAAKILTMIVSKD